VSAPVPLRLRPLEIGDLLDETFRMYRRHFLLFAGISVAVAIPYAALAGYGFAAFFTNLVSQAGTGQALDFNSLLPSATALIAGSLINLALLPFVAGAVVHAACESALGRPVTPWGVTRGVLGRYFQLQGYLILVWLMALAFCLLPLWTWIWVGWVAVIPAMFVERIGLVAAMGRSWRLVEGRWWRTFLILFLMVILFYLVRFALDAFLELGQIIMENFISPYLTLAIIEAAGIVVGSLVNPVLQIAIVLIYFDLRVRREALDLFQLAQRVTASPPATA
jgi:hypothetical protein